MLELLHQSRIYHRLSGHSMIDECGLAESFGHGPLASNNHPAGELVDRLNEDNWEGIVDSGQELVDKE